MRTWSKLAILAVAVALGGGLRADDTKKPGDKPGSDNKATRTGDDKRPTTAAPTTSITTTRRRTTRSSRTPTSWTTPTRPARTR